MKTGVHPKLSAEEYFEIDAINKSGLDLLEKSPLHYWSAYRDPNREPRRVTPAMKLGTAIHCAVLEPSKFNERYIVEPEGLDRRTKEGKAKAEELRSSNREVISHDDFLTVSKISESVFKNDAASTLLSGGKSEFSLAWIDPETNVNCKARLDYIAEKGKIIIDLKSAEDASPSGFSMACARYNLHRQAAWYLEGVERTLGLRPEIFVFVVFEKEPPFASAFYYASADMIRQGTEECRTLLKAYASCLARDEWPGYAEELREINLPKWRRTITSASELEAF